MCGRERQRASAREGTFSTQELQEFRSCRSYRIKSPISRADFLRRGFTGQAMTEINCRFRRRPFAAFCEFASTGEDPYFSFCNSCNS